MDKIKTIVIAGLSMLMSWLGILAVPVILLVLSNIFDYISGLVAAGYRQDGGISSYKSIRGITKKVCMWLLVVVGVIIDTLIQYTVSCTGATLHIPFVVATVVAVWLIVNEIISILENIMDIGVVPPPFLMPVVKYIKRQVEESADILDDLDDMGTGKEDEHDE